MAAVTILEHFCKGCGLCIAACPRNVLAISKHANEKGYYVAQAAQPENCIGCGLCGLMCPDVAIEVTKQGLERLCIYDKTRFNEG